MIALAPSVPFQHCNGPIAFGLTDYWCAAAAILSIPIAFVLGVVSLRQPEPTTPTSKPVSNAAPTVAICMVGPRIIALLEGVYVTLTF